MENYDAVLSAVAPFPALLHGTSFEKANRKSFGYAQMYGGRGARTSRWRWWPIWKKVLAAGKCRRRFESRVSRPSAWPNWS
jgi:hypothetical protein